MWFKVSVKRIMMAEFIDLAFARVLSITPSSLVDYAQNMEYNIKKIAKILRIGVCTNVIYKNKQTSKKLAAGKGP